MRLQSEIINSLMQHEQLISELKEQNHGVWGAINKLKNNLNAIGDTLSNLEKMNNLSMVIETNEASL